jgi:alpha-glucoside transport system substrate-binding protein
MAQSGFLTPLKTANPEAYANDALKKQGEILLNATTFRFDGSDLMPGKIGAGAFWTGMVDLSAASRPAVADRHPGRVAEVIESETLAPGATWGPH